MKKLAIMFVMLLGSVATMQAQSFDFSCEAEATVFINDAQGDLLVAEGFRIGREMLDGATEYTPRPNHYAWQIVPERVTLDALSNTAYRVGVLRRDQVEAFTTYGNFGDALLAMRIAQFSIDPPVITEAEAIELTSEVLETSTNTEGVSEDLTFELQNGHNIPLYTFSYDVDGDDYQLTIVPIRGGGFRLTNNYWSSSEAGYSNDYTTIAEAIAAVRLIIG